MYFSKRQYEKNIDVDTFVIPQIIDENELGLKSGKQKFKPSPSPSPLFGSKVKDVIRVTKNIASGEIIKRYDAFRPEEEKIENNKEKKRKYGTAFPEFNHITEEDREKIYGKTEIINEFAEPEKAKKTVVSKKLTFIESLEPNKETVLEEEVKPVSELKNVDDQKVQNDFEQNQSVGQFDFGDINISELSQEEETLEPVREVVDDEELEELTDNDSILSFDEKDSLSNSDAGFTQQDIDEEEYEVPFVQKTKRHAYKFPPLKIFSKTQVTNVIGEGNINERQGTINDTLANFGIPGKVVDSTHGPTFTRFEVLLEPGVNVKKILSIEQTLQANLGAESIRIQAPIPGKRTIGIEVPNKNRTTVMYGDIISKDFVNSSKPLEVALGKDIDGKIITLDIADSPHCLIAGATASGKSVCMNTILISLLLKNRPDELKLILIDPKQVEFNTYDELPHLVTPVISDPEVASRVLKWSCEEMEKRYTLLKRNRARNIADYNKKAIKGDFEKMSYIVIVIDELADLMQSCQADVEDSIKRLAQKARAAGIHLLVATQRPDVKTVSGGIKANIPTRIAFRVFSQTDSQVILDEGGAESLLGKGDMLVKREALPDRLQGAWIPDEEIDEVTDFIRDECEVDYILTHDDLNKVIERQNRIQTGQEESLDMLYDAAMFCVSNGTCSINSFQQRFQLGFNRAQRVVNKLEELGIVSKKTGSTTGREILVSIEQVDEIFGGISDEKF